MNFFFMCSIIFSLITLASSSSMDLLYCTLLYDLRHATGKLSLGYCEVIISGHRHRGQCSGIDIPASGISVQYRSILVLVNTYSGTGQSGILAFDKIAQRYEQ
jgi:hypothetical protein